MENLLPAILIILFPYAVIFMLCGMFNNYIMEVLLQDNLYMALLYLGVFWLIAFVSAIVICVRNIVCHRILQFVFCADVISCIIVYKKSKSAKKLERN